MPPISSPPPPPFFLSLLFLSCLCSGSHTLPILHPLYPVLSPARLPSPGHHSIFSILQQAFFLWRSDRGKNLEEGYFFLPCSFQVCCCRPRTLFNLKRQSSTDWNKLVEGGGSNGESVKNGGRGKEKVKWERREGEKEGSRDWWRQPCAWMMSFKRSSLACQIAGCEINWHICWAQREDVAPRRFIFLDKAK